MDEVAFGNAAPTRGAFGEPSPRDVRPSRGGFDSPGVGKEAIEMEEDMER
jgi:hypothetical protein